MLIFSGRAAAQNSEDRNLCQAEVAFLFLNGVQTTSRQARAGLEHLQTIHGTRASSTGERIRYDLLYNQTAGFEDFVETFEQRLLEQGGLLEGRFELFFASGGGFGWMDSKGYEIAGGQGQDFNLNWLIHAGVRYRASSGWRYSAGVYFQHISNRGMDDINPGLNSLGPTLALSRRF
jgi:hypothetical protein